MEKQFYSVSEFATKRGISKQAVYQQLNKTLKPFLKVENGKKYIDGAALELFKDKEVEQAAPQVEQDFKQVEQELESGFLLSQIGEKDKTIESLLKQIESLQEQNNKLTDLLQNSQFLLAADKKILIDQGISQKKEKKGFLGLFKKQDK